MFPAKYKKFLFDPKLFFNLVSYSALLLLLFISKQLCPGRFSFCKCFFRSFAKNVILILILLLLLLLLLLL